MRLATRFILPIIAFATPAFSQGTEPKVVDGFFVTKTPDGIAYITKPGNAFVGRWTVSCKIDGMTDNRRCYIYGPEQGSIEIVYGERSEPQFICVVGHDFPNKETMMRFDKAPAETSTEKGCVRYSENTPLTASSIRTRWYRWPYDRPIDNEVSTEGLTVAQKVVAEFQAGNLD